MKINRNSGWALFLIACGALILIGKLGFGLGHLMSYLFPIAMIGLGYLGIRNGSKFIGWVILVIGLLALLGKFSGLFAILIAAGLIGYGVTLLKRNPGVH
ncbi:LiaF transmembrane domain-containing protein [Paenibacillus sp. HJGM_3]|uniref:LiaF transmembrane domain-containing protein n=1 Tax=Paenibacillus sp. HJGM_3 TaxID=3379816 RepID=UPI00385E6CBA